MSLLSANLSDSVSLCDYSQKTLNHGDTEDTEAAQRIRFLRWAEISRWKHEPTAKF